MSTQCFAQLESESVIFLQSYVDWSPWSGELPFGDEHSWRFIETQAIQSDADKGFNSDTAGMDVLLGKVRRPRDGMILSDKRTRWLNRLWIMPSGSLLFLLPRMPIDLDRTRSGITITASYALKQSSRLLKVNTSHETRWQQNLKWRDRQSRGPRETSSRTYNNVWTAKSGFVNLPFGLSYQYMIYLLFTYQIYARRWFHIISCKIEFEIVNNKIDICPR